MYNSWQQKQEPTSTGEGFVCLLIAQPKIDANRGGFQRALLSLKMWARGARFLMGML
jgi:hypothetical protein